MDISRQIETGSTQDLLDDLIELSKQQVNERHSLHGYYRAGVIDDIKAELNHRAA